MRRAARVDGNHGEIVKALRSIGASVADTSAIGGGFPDLVVGFRGQNLLLEVKDGAKSPSRRRLTPEQAEWHRAWYGRVLVVKDWEEALAALNSKEIA